MTFDNVAVIAVKQKLSQAIEGDPIKPSTFAGDESATYATYKNGNRTDVVIDTQASQANRIEPLFDHSGLIPDSTVQIGNDKVPITSLGHRVCDAALRFSDGAGEITKALEAYVNGDAELLAKLAPTSLLFGCWDSRGNNRAKIQRLIRAEIRATDVSEPIISLGQYRASVPRPEGDTKNTELSAEGILDCPTSGLGGVIVNGEITRTVQLNLRALRKQAGGNAKPEKYLLGLALVGLLAPADLDLREGCNLITQSTTVELVKEDGTREPLSITHAEALEFAKTAAKEFGVGPARHFTYSEAKIAAKKVEREEKKSRKAAQSAKVTA